MFEKGTSVEITFSHHIESKSCYLNQAIQNEVFQTMTIMTTDINRSNRRKCSVKKVFLENLQNLQENTCARFSFLIKLQT